MPSSIETTAINVSMPAPAATGAVKFTMLLLFPAEQQHPLLMSWHEP